MQILEIVLLTASSKAHSGVVVGVVFFWREISHTQLYSDGIYNRILNHVPWRVKCLRDLMTRQEYSRLKESVLVKKIS